MTGATGTEVRRSERSRFALDVDTASYDYARRLLKEGQRPEPARIRPEEFVNSFRQDYPEPSDAAVRELAGLVGRAASLR
ncbi:von Willebrand factor type A domain-containing protein [Streptosporangium sp. NPDC048047]|uniref:VWA domain-containing protein n=1 Tax=Streptosporangium sp. NPDC048047 TaxID=3155748 RepID=UPI00342CA5CC